MAAKKRAVVRLRGGGDDGDNDMRPQVQWRSNRTGRQTNDLARVGGWDSQRGNAFGVNMDTAEIMRGEKLRGWLAAGGRVSAVGYDG